jgi:hypothetical protein
MLQTDKPMQRSTSAADKSHPDMVLIPGGTFRMGSDKHYPEEAPVHRVTVDAFRIDKTPVTNRQFKEFVRATDHVTVAEIVPDPKDYPGALPHMIYAGSLVFTPPDHSVDLRNWSEWWTFLRGANWRRPYGPKSNINVLDNHPTSRTLATPSHLLLAKPENLDLRVRMVPSHGKIRAVVPQKETAMPYVDFKAIKAAVSIEDAANLLKLPLKKSGAQLRSACPACSNDDERTIVLTPSRGLFYCFDAKVGGDCLALVQHITGLEVQDAAQFLAPKEATVPQKTEAGNNRPKKGNDKSAPSFDPAAFAAKLVYVEDLGSEEDAKTYGVGEHRGKLYIALRDDFGFIAGFVAVEHPTFPKTLLKNDAVVKLKRA